MLAEVLQPRIEALRDFGSSLRNQAALGRFFLDPVTQLSRLHREQGSVALLSDSKHRPWLCAFGRHNNKHLLSSPATFRNNPNPYPFAIRGGTALERLNHGMIYMDGDPHKRQRGLSSGAFHARHFPRYCEHIVAAAERLTATWSLGSQVDVSRAMRELTLCIAASTFFGIEPERDVRQLGSKLLAYLQALSSAGVFLLPLDLPGSPLRALYVGASRVDEAIRQLIEERRASGRPGADLMSALIQAHDEDGTALSDEELVANLVLFFIASHETASHALTWTIFLLSQHPNILADVASEIEARTHGAPPTYDDLRAMPLLNRIIRESLRILPPLIYMIRVAASDCELDGHSIRQNSRVIWSPYITHRDPEFYPNPSRFDPARWENLTPPPYTYVPFGAGPHVCIGSAFAMAEVALVLVVLLQRFHLIMPARASVNRRVQITLAPKNGLTMIISSNRDRLLVNRPTGNINEMVSLA